MKNELKKYYIAHKNSITSHVLNFKTENERKDWVKWYKDHFKFIAQEYQTIFSLELYNSKTYTFDVIAYEYRVVKGPGTLEKVDDEVHKAYLKAESEDMTKGEAEKYMDNFTIFYSVGKINRTHLLKPEEYALLRSDNSFISQKLFKLFTEGILNMNAFCEDSMFKYAKESYEDLDELQKMARKYKSSSVNLSAELLGEIENFVNNYKIKASYKSYRDMISYLYKTEEDARKEAVKRKLQPYRY